VTKVAVGLSAREKLWDFCWPQRAVLVYAA